MVPDPDLKIPSSGLKIKDRYIRIRIQKIITDFDTKKSYNNLWGTHLKLKNRARLMARTIG